MAFRRTCAAAISIAIILCCTAFPGGAFLCREVNGDVNLEPFHIPHAPLCVSGVCPSSEPDAAYLTHGHEQCTDSEVSHYQAPTKTASFRPDKAFAAVAGYLTAERSSVPHPASIACSAHPPAPSGFPSTILRI